MERLRRQTLLQSYRYFMMKNYTIQKIRAAIKRGVNPAEDDDYRDDYFMLIGEFGEGIFNIETDNNSVLVKEEDELNEYST